VDKRVIFSVAGSGKTTHIVDQLDLDCRVLLLTYTENNFEHLRSRIVQKFGYFPDNITLRTYFGFLYGFCYRPFLQMALQSKGINYSPPPAATSKLPLTNDARFIDRSGRVYHNRAAKLLQVKGCYPELIGRVERYFDCLFVDEVQDIAGHDFNLLLALSEAKIDVRFVGDFYQHTFDTSRDGSVNKSLHDSIEGYEHRFSDKGISVDKETLKKSRRCGTTTCDFIRANLDIDMYAYEDRPNTVTVVDKACDAMALHSATTVIKLFYDRHYNYNCYSQNWGASKGLDHFMDVCVVLNPQSWKALQNGTLNQLPAMTRNKLYVACSRARGNLFLAPDSLFKGR
jgi:DNA helicase II / ATP-dependent DNA helicase PcrA